MKGWKILPGQFSAAQGHPQGIPGLLGTGPSPGDPEDGDNNRLAQGDDGNFGFCFIPAGNSNSSFRGAPEGKKIPEILENQHR